MRKYVEALGVVVCVILFMLAGLLFCRILDGTKPCRVKNCDATVVIVETSLIQDAGRMGLVAYVVDGYRKGELIAVSTGAEGEGLRKCDSIRLDCWNEGDYCRVDKMLSKFAGSESECTDYLIERGILTGG